MNKPGQPPGTVPLSQTGLVRRNGCSGLTSIEIPFVVKHFMAYGTISRLLGATKQYCFKITFCILG